MMRGERGPTGDHGQQGERGPRGEAAPRPRGPVVAYLALALAMCVMGYWIWTVGQDGQDNLKSATANATYQSCVAGNRVRSGILLYLEKLTAKAPPARRKAARPAIRQAKVIFGPRNCAKAVAPIVRAR
jgi:hypothetical protein